MNHAWCARELSCWRRCTIDGAQAVYAAASSSPLPASITDAPLLCWHEATHCAFPREFQEQVRALLLCWQRLGGGSSGSGVDSSSTAAPTIDSGGDVEMAEASVPECDASLGSLPYDLVGAAVGGC